MEHYLARNLSDAKDRLYYEYPGAYNIYDVTHEPITKIESLYGTERQNKPDRVSGYGEAAATRATEA